MVTKKENAKPKEFKGVSFDVLAVGEKSMVTRMNYKIGDNVPAHAHPNEQSGYVVSGKYRIRYKMWMKFLLPGIVIRFPKTWHMLGKCWKRGR